MSKKENFKRELRKFRRRWFPTEKEREEKRSFMNKVIIASKNCDDYIAILKKG